MNYRDVPLDAWKRLGRTFRIHRARLGLEYEDVAEVIGCGVSTIREYEGNRRQGRDRVPDRMHAYAAMLGWTYDSIDKVLAGEEPELLPPSMRPLLERKVPINPEAYSAALAAFGKLADKDRELILKHLSEKASDGKSEEN
jgi:transcriptional regulator with XRE-family HTH domain